MTILDQFDQLSYAKVLSIAVFVAILFAVPVGVYLVQQKTQISSRAAFEKPKLADQHQAAPGPIPAQAPKLGRVFPWVGKIGDLIWIQGWNFGQNPAQKRLVIGGVEVPPAQIDSWEDTLIQAYIPVGAKQGGSVDVYVGNHPAARSLPYTLYDSTTAVKIRGRNPQAQVPDQGNSWLAPMTLTAEGATTVVRAVVWTGDDVIPTQQHLQAVQPNPRTETPVFTSPNLPILSVVLLDAAGNIVPYYVDPLEFDF